MTEHMIADGYGEKSITSIDISPVVIDQMRGKHPEFDCMFYRFQVVSFLLLTW